MPGGYWLCPDRIASTAASSTSFGPSLSGNPCPRLTAPVDTANADISAKIVVPNPASRRFSGEDSVPTGAEGTASPGGDAERLATAPWRRTSPCRPSASGSPGRRHAREHSRSDARRVREAGDGGDVVQAASICQRPADRGASLMPPAAARTRHRPSARRRRGSGRHPPDGRRPPRQHAITDGVAAESLTGLKPSRSITMRHAPRTSRPSWPRRRAARRSNSARLGSPVSESVVARRRSRRWSRSNPATDPATSAAPAATSTAIRPPDPAGEAPSRALVDLHRPPSATEVVGQRCGARAIATLDQLRGHDAVVVQPEHGQQHPVRLVCDHDDRRRRRGGAVRDHDGGWCPRSPGLSGAGCDGAVVSAEQSLRATSAVEPRGAGADREAERVGEAPDVGVGGREQQRRLDPCDGSVQTGSGQLDGLPLVVAGLGSTRDESRQTRRCDGDSDEQRDRLPLHDALSADPPRQNRPIPGFPAARSPFGGQLRGRRWWVRR